MRTLRTSSAAVIVFLLATVWPHIAAACPVCFSATGESRVAFIKTTIILTSMPLLLAGAAFWWLRRRLREHRKREFGRLGIPDDSSQGR